MIRRRSLNVYCARWLLLIYMLFYVMSSFLWLVSLNPLIKVIASGSYGIKWIYRQHMGRSRNICWKQFSPSCLKKRKKKKKKETSTAAGKFGENPSRSVQSNRTDYPVMRSHKCDANFTKRALYLFASVFVV